MFISRLVEVPVPDDGGLHVCLSACGLLFNDLLFSLYKVNVCVIQSCLYLVCGGVSIDT